MLTQISWRNVWRNRLRSLVVIVAVVLGLTLGIFMMSFSWGINSQRARNIIESQISHVQIHEKEFKDDFKMSRFVPDGAARLEAISQRPEVVASTGRLKTNAMLSTSRSAHGVQVSGIDTLSEKQLTKLNEKLVAGKFLAGTRSNPILIGDKLAERIGWRKTDTLKLERTRGFPWSLFMDATYTEDSLVYTYTLRKKLVLSFRDASGEPTSARFRVTGVFKTVNSKFDETNVFVLRDDLARLAQAEGEVHQIAIRLENDEMAKDTSNLLTQFGRGDEKLQVENWMELAPDLALLDQSFVVSLTIFMGIILLALLFTIINTMLMAVMERTRELGMLMAIGMKRGQIFRMVMLETLFLSLLGGPIGLLIAYGLVSLFGTVGIDLSKMADADASSQFGISSMAYTYLEPEYYALIAIMVLVTAFIASVFPAFKAFRMNPIEAMRSQ
ncbi:MAG: FtsX-like permease family protein [Bacteroidota bacterium]